MLKKSFGLLFLILSSCATLQMSPLDSSTTNIEINSEGQASIGDIFFTDERMRGTQNGDGTVFNGSADKIELRVKSVSKSKISLDYSEYLKPYSSYYGGFRKQDSWAIKPAFNKTLDFDLSETKKINYESYEFEITKIEPNKVTFKRLK